MDSRCVTVLKELAFGLNGSSVINDGRAFSMSRLRKPSVIVFSILVAILSTITEIGTILYLQIFREIFQKLGTSSSVINFIFSGQYWLWLGIILSLIIGWLYSQYKFSERLSILLLSGITILLIGYALVGAISINQSIFNTFEKIK
jgi:hypothetical protein